MRKHPCLSILLMASAFGTSCTSPQKAESPDTPKPPAVAKESSKAEARMVIHVAEDGTPSSVKVLKSSGHSSLDQHTVDWIKKNWRWPAGKAGTYAVPVQYKAQ